MPAHRSSTSRLLAALLTLAACDDPAPEREFCPEPAFHAHEGTLETARGAFGFDSVDAVLDHNERGPEAGCLTGIYLHFKKSDDHRCSLWVAAENFADEAGHLRVTDATLDASGNCPGFPAGVDGLYVARELGDSVIAFDGGAQLSPADAHDGCYESNLELRLAGAFERVTHGPAAGAPEILEVARTRLQVEGPIATVGEPSSCPRAD